MRRPNPWYGAALASIAYLAFAVALTWPVVLRLRSTLYADYGDMRGWIWWVWAKSHGLLDGPVNRLHAAPFGVSNAGIIGHPIPDGIVVALARATDEITAVNVLLLLSFPLTALATYALLAHLLRSRGAAFFGGLAFGFCPAAVMQAVGGHVSFSLNLFLPLFLLALFANRARRTAVSAFLVALAFAAIMFTAIYMAYFAVFLGLLFVAFDVLTLEVGNRRTVMGNYALCALFSLALIVPVEFSAFREQVTATTEMLRKAGHQRSFRELDIFSARPWNYLVPPIDHPVFGPTFESFVRSNLHASNVFEQTLYLGIVPVALWIAGLVISAQGRLDPAHRRMFHFFSLAAASMYLLSLPPIVGRALPTPSYFLYDVAPMFRVYARAGIVVSLCVASAAAVVLAHWCARMPARRFRVLLASLVLLLAFEFAIAPPERAHPVDQPPPVYKWLSTKPGDFIIAEYPMSRWDEASFYTYPFWQRVHRKRLLNGASPEDADAWSLFEKVRNLGDPRTPALLAAAGVKYVILHRGMYRDGPIPAALKRYYSPERAALMFNGGIPEPVPEGLALAKTFGDDLVFEVRPR